MKKTASIQTAVIVLAAVVIATASSVFAQWVGPTAAPPGNNVSAPLNVGATTQTKTGGLWADSMGTDNGYCIGTDCITTWPDTLSENSVSTSMIVDNAVTAAKIATGTITTGKTDFVGTLQESKWCTVSGGDIVCTADAPASGADCFAGGGEGWPGIPYTHGQLWNDRSCSGNYSLTRTGIYQCWDGTVVTLQSKQCSSNCC